MKKFLINGESVAEIIITKKKLITDSLAKYNPAATYIGKQISQLNGL